MVAIEEPLGLRVQGRDYAILMRTPGRDLDLVCGFLAAEGILAGPEDLAAVAPCEVATGQACNVALAPGVPFDLRDLRMRTVSSACGLCGAQSIEALRLTAPRALPMPPPILEVEALLEGFAQLRRRQPLFAATAGSHGAALVRLVESPDSSSGGLRTAQSLEILDVAEDVGRHNAVDKLLGASLRSGDYPLAAPTGLLVSGRISYELVQKAVLGGLAWVAGVGMPTSLAVEGAIATNRSLFAWVRDGGVSHYAGPTRLSAREPGIPGTPGGD